MSDRRWQIGVSRQFNRPHLHLQDSFKILHLIHRFEMLRQEGQKTKILLKERKNPTNNLQIKTLNRLLCACSHSKNPETGEGLLTLGAYQFVGLHIEGDNALIRGQYCDLHLVDSNANLVSPAKTKAELTIL